MASARAKQFKERLAQNKGKTISDISEKGMTDKMYGKVVEIWDKEKIIHVDIQSPYISASDKIDLKIQCEQLLPYIEEYKEGQKICLSNVCNTIFDIKIIKNCIAEGKNYFQCITI